MNSSDLIQIDLFGNGKWKQAYLKSFGTNGIWAMMDGILCFVPNGNYALVW